MTARASTALCGSCGAEIVWCVDAKTNRLAPVDADASEYGNVSIHVDPVSREPQQVVLGKAKAAAMRAAGQPLYLSHFASCPHADRWRKDYR